MAEEVKKKRSFRRVMNNVQDIDKQSSDVSPLSLFGASAMGFPDKISTVRGVMATRHTSQRVVLSNPEFARVYTGAENEFGKRSSWDIRVKNGDVELVKTFRKFKNWEHSTVLYIFRNISTGKYSCQVIRPGHNLIEKYGFKMNDNIAGKYHDGDILPEGTSIAQSSSYVNDNYCGGRNIRFAYTVLPELTEDAILLSETAAKDLEYDMVDIVEVKVNKNAFLLNKYGTNGLYKPFPDLGEYINNQILCAVRENSYVSSVAEASIPHINDKKYYSDGQIIDIEIYTNVEVENDQFNYYHSQIREWYTEIYTYISTIITDKTQDDSSLLDIYQQAEKYLNKSTWVTKEYIADTIIKFHILQHKHIRNGQKIVGRFGNKGVVADIIPDRIMPRTDDGRPIHMVCNSLGVLNRIISFATYESNITFMSERMHQYLVKMHDEGKSKDDIINLACDFISIFNPKQGEDVRGLYIDYPTDTYNDLIKNGIYIQIQPMNEVCVRDALIEAQDRYRHILIKYKVQDKLRHRWILLDGEYSIGYQYIWVLKQEPGKAMSSVATGRTTLYDVPVKTRQYNKHLRRHSDNPIKFGEYDTANFEAGVPIRDFAKLTTYFRGSQYEDNSILMSHLNDCGIDVNKYNKFPQLDHLTNVLNLIGAELAPDIFGYSTIGTVDEMHEVYINNVKIQISVSELRLVLIIHSYYLQYEEFKKGPIDMIEFFKNMDETNVFVERTPEYVNYIYEKFLQLLPILQQLKQY